MPNPFDLDNATIRDLPYVLVVRQAAEPGSRCTYRKQFKAEGLRGADYWLQRENQFLLDFAAEGLKHVVELSELKRVGDGQHTPLVSLLATFDAGVTVEDWLKLRPRYANGTVYSHPFTHAGQFLLLLRACLVALKEIHGLGIVHCDIKADNLCIPPLPYPFAPGPGRQVAMDFDHLRLIDFAFSVTAKRPLQQALPILPVAPYQSNLLKTALQADQSGRQRPAAQDLDCRADLYSLGFMAQSILETGLFPPAGAAGRAAYDFCFDLVKTLKAFDGGKRPKLLPHDGLIAQIDARLTKLNDLDIYHRFVLTEKVEDMMATPVLVTPVTPVVGTEAEPVARTESGHRASNTTPQAESGGQSRQVGVARQDSARTDSRWKVFMAFLAMAFLLILFSMPFIEKFMQRFAGQTNAVNRQEFQSEAKPNEKPRPSVPSPHKDFGIEMVNLPGGTFQMGCGPRPKVGKCQDNEKPRHAVTVQPFAIGQAEVTRGQWKAVMGAPTPELYSEFEQCGDDCPVEDVSWDDVQAFIAKLNQRTNKQYRLPTEAEWEYACRAGQETLYCGGDDADGVAWYRENSSHRTHPVKGKRANAFGLYDMSGNVEEYVQDCEHGSYQNAPADGNNCANHARVLRGGSRGDFPYDLRSASRGNNFQLSPYYFSWGFRLARTD